MEAAIELARDYFHRTFSPIEAAERELLRKELEQRRRVEVLYRTDISSDPLLLDESLYGTAPRTDQQLAWAEQRLTELGFQMSVADSAKQYTLERPELIVYADPRGSGEITFRVYRKPLPKRKRPMPAQVFSLKDNWKNDLKGKFEARLGPA
ncbi:MAG: hypothetical protein QOF24_2347 [Verrucomicrobiota bacterium]|jgi:hypothetical protein